jgi:hypothetical protein
MIRLRWAIRGFLIFRALSVRGSFVISTCVHSRFNAGSLTNDRCSVDCEVDETLALAPLGLRLSLHEYRLHT